MVRDEELNGSEWLVSWPCLSIVAVDVVHREEFWFDRIDILSKKKFLAPARLVCGAARLGSSKTDTFLHVADGNSDLHEVIGYAITRS